MDGHPFSNPTGNSPSYSRRSGNRATNPPDVFRFLASHPDADSSERVDALLIDQQYRWRRGEPLPLQAYLRGFPDIAARPVLVRRLVEGDQSSRRATSARAFHLLEKSDETTPTQALTQVMRLPSDDHETISERPANLKRDRRKRAFQASKRRRGDAGSGLIETHEHAGEFNEP